MTRISRLWALVVVVGATAVACSAHKQPESHLRVTTLMTYEHPVEGHDKVFRGPLTGHAVVANGSSGRRVVGMVDKHGLAILTLTPGSYEVTVSIGHVCAKRRISLADGATRSLELTCVAP